MPLTPADYNKSLDVALKAAERSKLLKAPNASLPTEDLLNLLEAHLSISAQLIEMVNAKK